MKTEPLWRKSSYSNGSGECVEVAFLRDGRVAVRDSKHRAGPVLVVSADEWEAFLGGVVTDELDGS